MTRLLLVLLLVCPQDGNPRRLIQQLGDDRPAARDQAEQALLDLGPEALDALRDAVDHRDAEVRMRVAALLRRIDQSVFLKPLTVAQRPRKIGLLAADQAGKPDEAFIDGARFRFSRSAWKDQGTVIRTAIEPCLDGAIQWSVASVREGGEVRKMDQCGVHGPYAVYLPGEAPLGCTVVVKGVRRWFCDVPVEFKEPADGEKRRLGPLTVMLKWPHLEVVADHPLPEMVALQAIPAKSIQAKGHARLKPTIVDSLAACPDDEPAIFFPEAKEGLPAWCGCAGAPESTDDRSPGLKKWQVLIPDSRKFMLQQLTSLSFMVRVPIEEPFEVESPPLK